MTIQNPISVNGHAELLRCCKPFVIRHLKLLREKQCEKADARKTCGLISNLEKKVLVFAFTIPKSTRRRETKRLTNKQPKINFHL